MDKILYIMLNCCVNLASSFEQLLFEFLTYNYAKKWKKLLSLEGGGYLQKSTWFSRGLAKKTMSVHKGEGWSKISKIPSTWFMDAPQLVCPAFAKKKAQALFQRH